MHHFIAIGQLKLELQSGNAKFGSKSAIFCPVWLWNLTEDLGKQYGTSYKLLQALCIISWPSVNSNYSYSPETPNSGQNQQFFVPCDLEIWRITLKSNRPPLLCYFKLFLTAFHSHQPIQAGVTVRKGPIRVKIGNFLPRVTLKFDRWPWKTIGHLFYTTRSFVHHFIAIGQFKLELKSGNAKFGSKSAILCPVWPWSLTDDLAKQ